MKRMLVFLFACLVLAAGTTRAMPVRQPYVPEKPPPLPKTIDLNGTAWLGKYLTSTRTFIFEADGTLSYKTTTKTIFKNRDTWRLEGKTLQFEFVIAGSKLMDFRGTIQDSGAIVGESWNNAGVRTPQTLRRATVVPK